MFSVPSPLPLEPIGALTLPTEVGPKLFANSQNWRLERCGAHLGRHPAGDTPKIYDIDLDGLQRQVVGVGCKDGAYYIIDRLSGELLNHTPKFTGPRGVEVAPRKLVNFQTDEVGGAQSDAAYRKVQMLAVGDPAASAQPDS